MTAETSNPSYQTLQGEAQPTKEVNRKTSPPATHIVRPSDDFLDDYVTFADYVEMPKLVHSAMALSIIAAVANERNIIIWNGDLKISFDLWQLILKGSGAGKNSVLGPFHEILEHAQLNLISGVGFGSMSHAMQHLADCPNDLLILSEMSATLGDWRGKQFEGLIPWLTDRYDEFRLPTGKEYRERKKEEDQTPAIKFTEPPRLGILGMSAESWFFKTFQRDDAKGGFLPRFSIEWIEEKGRRIPTPRKPPSSTTLLPSLASKLKKIAHGKPLEMRLDSDAQKRYEAWYQETATRFEGFNNQAIIEPMWHRHRTHLFKFAGCYQLSSTPQAEITLASLERAIVHCKSLEPAIAKIAAVQLTQNGAARQELEEFVKSGEEKGRSKRDVFRSLRGKSEQERLDTIRGLIREETIFRFSVKTATRPREDYVHCEHVEKYTRENNGKTTPLGTDNL